MPKYIELIDKYLIKQETGDYNPPSYIWTDNTGEIIRCKDCKYYEKQIGWHRIEFQVCSCSPMHKPIRQENDFCSYAERREE